MGDGNSKKSKLSWPKRLVKKWFNIKSKAEDFHADDVDHGGDSLIGHGFDSWICSSRSMSYFLPVSKIHVLMRLGLNFTDREACTIKKSKTERPSKRYSDRVRRCKIDPDVSQFADVHNYSYRNVAGKSPPGHLNLEDWLPTSPPADIYKPFGSLPLAFLRFQEIVPLNAVPGTSGDFHTPSPVPYPLVELDADFEGSRPEASSFFHRRSFQSLSRSMRMDNDMAMPHNRGLIAASMGFLDDENVAGDSPGNAHYSEYSPMSYGGSFAFEESNRPMEHSRYCLVASKQMVGIFLTVWVKSDLRDDVRNLKVSCVGRGLMGYLGNKGSISISMSLHRTSFCFVCSHLTSGQKEGDELRRNSDVMEILRKTSRVIWLGDLNYRIALSYRSAKALVEMRDWKSLLENDQASSFRTKARSCFRGLERRQNTFPPTYKYSNNSDRYAGEDRHPKEKRRTPAWCDRILWYGQGLYQLSYVRGESSSQTIGRCIVYFRQMSSLFTVAESGKA
ncbi:Type I inositol 1,4,5-trisphosphate 5-phosphatase CVP2 [Hibiscus syriacus]|uniref:Type I inositol 1,4,5-trisphosphate 5-phosphatase CVP2 n=1 Tax=Hibiscus syriacus TaxID=106335 RepID=A0A6A3AAH9_HIBSY|nr:Type I inositol 1,4,5-trisphosphate 5-phosphatase CVP2 [Hibiscus syriacus]